MPVFEISPETHYAEDHGDGHVYTGWKSNSAATDVETLDVLYGLVRFTKPDLVVETGTLAGHGAYTLALACAHNGKGRVVSCDINLEAVNAARESLKNVQLLEVRHQSSLALPELQEAEFVFSDSGFDIRTQEYALVKHGCIFVIHDTNHTDHPEQAHLADFVKRRGGMLLQYGRGIGILQKGMNG